MKSVPSKWFAVFLALVFGIFGAHMFYLRKYHIGVLWVAGLLLFAWTKYMPAFLYAASFAQAVYYMTLSRESWALRYGREA